jgi:DNA polymerase-4
MDAFYASVAQRDHPELRGIPLAVSGNSRRAVVLTASYEARPFGVRSAMPLYRALELCPKLTVTPPDFPAYKATSERVFAIFADGARAVEGLSLDEAFVDIGADVGLDAAVAFAVRVRARVFDEVGLTISAGVAATKMVAKIASDTNKPNGLTIVPPGTEAAFLAPMPIGRLWGIGPKTQPRLEEAGVKTIADVAALDDAQLFALFGRSGVFYRDLALGIDDRTVDPSRERKSISTETTFEYDVRDDARVRAILREQADELSETMREKAIRGATIGVKVKFADHQISGRQTTLSVATNEADAILAAALVCWKRSGFSGVPIRLLGTRIASITEEPERELRLF